MQNIIYSFNNHTETVAHLAGRLRNLNDKLTGPQPERLDPGKGAIDAGKLPILPEIERANGLLGVEIENLRQQINRLETILELTPPMAEPGSMGLVATPRSY